MALAINRIFKNKKHSYSYKRKNEEIKALCFTGILIGIILTSLFVSFTSAGPIILGTELNTNGLVEYLCIGSGCENLTRMDW